MLRRPGFCTLFGGGFAAPSRHLGKATPHDGNAVRSFPGKSRKTGDLGRFSLYGGNALKFPLYCLAYAAADGCRLSLPAASGCRPCRPENRGPWPLFPVWWNALKFPLYCLAYAAGGGCRLSLPDSSVALRRQLPFHGSLLRFRTMSPLKGEVGAKRAEGFETRRIRELEFMVPEFVARTGGSNRVQAQPAGGRESVLLRGGCADRSFSGEPRKTEEIDHSNLWRSISCAIAR